MEILRALGRAFSLNTGDHNHPESARPKNRSFELGVVAAEAHTFLTVSNANEPIAIERYTTRQEKADELLDALLKDDDFDYGRFEQGFRSIMGIPYNRESDLLSLNKKVPGIFERFPVLQAGANGEVFHHIWF